jgi:hypothetical protein
VEERVTDESKKEGVLSIKTEIPSELWGDLLTFFKRIAGPLAESSDFLSDKIRYFRFRSALRTIQRAKEIAADADIQVHQVPTRFLVSFLEQCSLEDEGSDLTELWAGLLVSAAEKYDDRHAAYANILSQIGPRDALLLKAIFNRYKEAKLSELQAMLTAYAAIDAGSNWDGQTMISLDDHHKPPHMLLMAGNSAGRMGGDFVDQNIKSLPVLERQNLIKVRATVGVHINRPEEMFVVSAVLTPLGFGFVNACERQLAASKVNK